MATYPRKSTFTNAEGISYDSTLSAMSFLLFNSIGGIKLAPINPEFVGKQPKKGDKVYDHENSVILYLSPSQAKTIKLAVESLLSSVAKEEHIKSVEVELGKNKKFYLYAPGVKMKNPNREPIDTSENYVLRISTNSDDEAVEAMHVMQNSEFISSVGKEQYTNLVNVDVQLLLDFLQDIILVGHGAIRHGAVLANGGNSSSAAKAKTSSVGIIDEDDDDVEAAMDEVMGGSSKASTTKPSKSSLEAEFDD